MLTFADCKADEGLLAVSGCCGDTTRFAYLVNAATRALMKRGDFLGTVSPIQVCVRGGCIVWPRYVGSVRKVNLCSRGFTGHRMRELPIGNDWYQFLNPHHMRSEFHSHMHNEPVMFAEGRAPTYNTVFGDGRLIRAYPACRADLGKTVRLFGLDNGNQPLRTNNGDGTWSEGLSIVLDDPFGSTSVYVRSIDRVVKDVTQCQVFLYAYNAAANVLEDLAVYDPGETSPSYTRDRLQLDHHQANCVHSVIALVKFAPIPVKFDTDLVGIENIDALKLAIQSIRAGEAGDRASSQGFLADAVADLNRELNDAFDDDTFSSSNRVFAGRSFRNRMF